jgi:hypothetical protein
MFQDIKKISLSLSHEKEKKAQAGYCRTPLA